MKWSFYVEGIALGVSVVCYGCKDEPKTDDSVTSAAPAASPAPPEPLASASASPSKRPSLYANGAYPIPDGPALVILPGEGVGPIRFGATVETIERLMDKPCEIRTKEFCKYPARAIDFMLSDGVVDEIRIHRVDRLATPMPKPRIYGVFNGRFESGLTLGMVPTAVEELAGKPLRKEALATPTDNQTIEVFYYPKMRLEMDKLDNGSVALGGVILTGPNAKPAKTR